MANEFEICIPSYHRAEKQKTLELLHKLGLPKEWITLSVQTLEDKVKYTDAGVAEKVGRFIYREGHCSADNRNTLLDLFPFGTKIVLLEDDINKICALKIDKTTNKRKLVEISSVDEFVELCRKGFAIAQLEGTVGFGLNLYRNPYFMRSGYHKRKICDTSFFGLINTEMRFDNQMILFDDSDMVARIIKRYKYFISIESHAAMIDRRVKGGCYELWKQPEIRMKMIKRIKAHHGDIYDVNPNKENCITLKRGSAK